MEEDWAKEATAQLHRAAIYKGSDVRLTDGVLLSPSIWPRQTVDIGRWDWYVCVSYSKDGAHINVLELNAILAAHQWRARAARHIGKRIVHFTDSQVSLAVFCKGRSSSQAIMRILKRLNALVLAGCLFPVYAYVRTDLNPADAPSRWGRT